MRMRGRPWRHGFTLAELVVVLVILGMVAGTVVPALRVTEPDALSLAADEVTRVLLAGRTAALQAGAPIRLTVNPSTLEFVIEPMGDSTPKPLGRGTLALPAGVTLAEQRPRVRVVFARAGVATPDSVTLRSPQGTRMIRLDVWSGAPMMDPTRAESR